MSVLARGRAGRTVVRRSPRAAKAPCGTRSGEACWVWLATVAVVIGLVVVGVGVFANELARVPAGAAHDGTAVFTPRWPALRAPDPAWRAELPGEARWLRTVGD